MTAEASRCGWLVRRAAVLGGVLIVAASAPARAATPVFVDGAGMCAGLTPCFTTIQVGVNNAGPAPALVNVFPGTYAESVDLGLMGSAIAGSAGDLTLRTVDSAGTPAAGTVNVLPAAGAALRDSLSPFPGNVTIEGFTVKSPNDTGILLSGVTGTLTLADIVCDGNAIEGLVAGISAGDMRISNSSFSGNLGGSGIHVKGPTDVTFDLVTADGNMGSGASFTMSGTLVISHSSFSQNTNGNGLNFFDPVDVTVDEVVADGNQNTGADFSMTGVLRISNSSFSNTKNGGGLIFSNPSDVIFEAVVADGNQNSGADFSMSGALRITHSSFSNAKNGGGLIFSNPSEVVFEAVVADGNQNSGADFGLNGSLRISHSSFSNARNGNGLIFSSPIDTTFDAIVVDGNSGDGVSAQLGNARITGSRFDQNGGIGLQLSPTPAEAVVRLSCNDIAGNMTGLRLAAMTLVDARHNYWGAPSGPTHPNNPGGSGDSIIDGNNGGLGVVEFQPFLTVPSAESAFCNRGAPALGSWGLAVLLLGLLVLPGWRLARRDAASHS